MVSVLLTVDNVLDPFVQSVRKYEQISVEPDFRIAEAAYGLCMALLVTKL